MATSFLDPERGETETAESYALRRQSQHDHLEAIHLGTLAWDAKQKGTYRTGEIKLNKAQRKLAKKLFREQQLNK